MTDQSIETQARKILYILVAEQKLRVGEGMAADLLAKDLERHGISGDDQKQALQQVISNGWLQKGPADELQLTDKGFDFHFGQ